MLVLNILSGKEAGKSFPLKQGKFIIGRSPQADITLSSSQISKHHAELIINDDIVTIKDLGSRNGTFINGQQIREKEVKFKDKITLHDIVMIIRDDKTHDISNKFNQQPTMQAHGNTALDQNQFRNISLDEPQVQNNEPIQKPAKNLQEKTMEYLDNVVLPGVYNLTVWFDFKWVLAGFLGALIFLITILSTLPAISLLKTSIEKESQRRALTIAKNLAEINKTKLAQGLHSSINLNSAANEAGVIQALIIANDGTVIAPSSMAGEQPDIPFIHTARREAKIQVKQISTNEIGAIVPIRFYNSNTGSQSVAAHSFILYDMGSLAIDDGQTISLYIQVLFISLIVGSILMFFIFKIFEYPFTRINSQLNEELKNPIGNIKLDYNFDITQKLIANINSALTRSQSDQNNISALSSFDRSSEINNIVQVIGFPALAILSSNQSIASFNQVASELLQIQNDFIGNNIEKINDQALKLNLKDLISQLEINSTQIASNQLDISGAPYDIMALGVYGTKEIEYFIITFVPGGEME